MIRCRCLPGVPCDQYRRLMQRGAAEQEAGDLEAAALWAGLGADHRRLARLEREAEES